MLRVDSTSPILHRVLAYATVLLVFALRAPAQEPALLPFLAQSETSVEILHGTTRVQAKVEPIRPASARAAQPRILDLTIPAQAVASVPQPLPNFSNEGESHPLPDPMVWPGVVQQVSHLASALQGLGRTAWPVAGEVVRAVAADARSAVEPGRLPILPSSNSSISPVVVVVAKTTAKIGDTSASVPVVDDRPAQRLASALLVGLPGLVFGAVLVLFGLRRWKWALEDRLAEAAIELVPAKLDAQGAAKQWPSIRPRWDELEAVGEGAYAPVAVSK